MGKLGKLANYEKRDGIFLLIIIFFMLLIILLIYTVSFKISSYYLMRGVVFKDDLLELVASDEELKRIYKNGQFYIDDKKYKYVIENVIKDAFSKNEETYNIVYLACKLSNEKEKDVVDLVFLDGKFYLFRIFELIWKGD